MTEEKKVSFIISLISGGIAGTTVDVALFPLDTIKTRMQTNNDTFIHAIVKKQLFKGLGFTLLRGFIVNGAGFLSISLMLKYYK